MTQKHRGILLIGIGLIALAVSGVGLYLRLSHASGFASVLPKNETVALLEFPLQEKNPVSAYLAHKVGLNWEKDILPLVGEKGAIVLLFSEKEKKIKTALLFEIKDEAEAQKLFTEKKISMQWAAVFGDIVVLTPNKDDVALFDAPTKLADDREFKKMYSKHADDFFAYYSGVGDITSYFTAALPPLLFLQKNNGPAYLSANYKNGTFTGSSSVPVNPGASMNTSYHAKLLTSIPDTFDGFIAGPHLNSYIDLQGDTLAKMGGQIIKTYLPEITKEDFSAVLDNEFAGTITGDQLLLAVKIDHTRGDTAVKKIRGAIQKAAVAFTTEKRAITLPDGTNAQEIFPNPELLTLLEESFGKTTVNGVVVNSKGDGVFDAVYDGTWFVSTDLLILKTALRLAMREDKKGSLRESDLYKKLLQPILKNPHLIGITETPIGTVSFSKRSGEVNFILLK